MPEQQRREGRLGFLKTLLKLIGITGRGNIKEAEVMDGAPASEPRHIDPSAFQWEQIAKRHAEFIEDMSSKEMGSGLPTSEQQEVPAVPPC